MTVRRLESGRPSETDGSSAADSDGSAGSDVSTAGNDVSPAERDVSPAERDVSSTESDVATAASTTTDDVVLDDVATGSGGERQVLVVGGGLGGLALAGFLLNRGVRPVVVERSDGRSEHTDGLVLREATLDRLAELALAEPVRRKGRELRTWTLRDPGGGVRARRESTSGTTPPAVAISRGRLRRLLLESLPPSIVRTDTSLSRIEQSRPAVEVEFDDGVREQFDVVVGADGVHSRVRTWVRDGSSIEPLGTMSWTFALDSHVGPSDDLTEIWGTDGWAFASLPLTDGRVGHLVTVTDEVPSDWRPPDGPPPDRFPGLEAVEAVDPTTNEPSRRVDYRVRPGAWQNGRVALLGDAAHAVHPLAGVGAALAIGDACVLADELDPAGDGSPSDGQLSRALASYVDRRRPRLRKRVESAPAPSATTYGSSPLADVLDTAVGIRAEQLQSLFGGVLRE